MNNKRWAKVKLSQRFYNNKAIILKYFILNRWLFHIRWFLFSIQILLAKFLMGSSFTTNQYQILFLNKCTINNNNCIINNIYLRTILNLSNSCNKESILFNNKTCIKLFNLKCLLDNLQMKLRISIYK